MPATPVSSPAASPTHQIQIISPVSETTPLTEPKTGALGRFVVKHFDFSTPRSIGLAYIAGAALVVAAFAALIASAALFLVMPAVPLVVGLPLVAVAAGGAYLITHARKKHGELIEKVKQQGGEPESVKFPLMLTNKGILNKEDYDREIAKLFESSEAQSLEQSTSLNQSTQLPQGE